MMNIKDPLLRKIGIPTLEPVTLINDRVGAFNLLTEEIVRVVISYLKLTWELKGDESKKIPFDEIITNTNFLFSKNGKYQDKLWIEHTSTNLRELFNDLEFDDYQKAIKNIAEEERNGLFERIWNIKSYLNDVIHYKPAAAKKWATKLLTDSDYVSNSESVLEKHEIICISLFYCFYEIYRKYAYSEIKK